MGLLLFAGVDFPPERPKSVGTLTYGYLTAMSFMSCLKLESKLGVAYAANLPKQGTMLSHCGTFTHPGFASHGEEMDRPKLVG